MGHVLAGMNFTTFGPEVRVGSGPYYSSTLGLWVSLSVSGTTFTETFYQDQAKTVPAGSATYTLNLETQTLSGGVTITKGPYAGLQGTYSQTVTSDGASGNYSFTLPSGTTVVSQFQVTLGNGSVPSGTSTDSITYANGYSVHATITYNSDKTFRVVASDSNGFQGSFNFAADLSGTGTIDGPLPGLPASVAWNSAGTGQVTFSNGLVVSFTGWQFTTL